MNPIRVADLSRLLLDEPVSYYWMGFLIADGTFYEKAVKLHLSEKDRAHLEAFKMFVNYTGDAKMCSISVMHPTVVPAIKDKFDIQQRKTYNPCDLSRHHDALLFSLIVGMLDGDGSVRWRDGEISAFEIKLHGSWFKQLSYIEQYLYCYFDMRRDDNKMLTRLRNDGYSQLLLTDRLLLARMKFEAQKLGLPCMSRKWDGINVQYQGRIRNCANLAKEIKAMKEMNLSFQEISQKMNLTCRQIYSLNRRNKK